MHGIGALVLAGCAALFLSVAVVFHGRAVDPSSTPPGIRRGSAASNRFAALGAALGGSFFAVCALTCAGVALGVLGDGPKDPAVPDGPAPIAPALLLGGETTFRSPERHIEPNQARLMAAPCGVTLGLLVVGVVVTGWVWRLPVFAYVIAAVLGGFAALWLARVVGVLLAERRLHVRFTRAPRRARRGGRVEVEVELRPREPVQVDAVHLIFAGVHERPVGREQPTTLAEVLHREVRRHELTAPLGARPRRLRCTFQVPADAAASTPATRARETTRWMVAVLVDIPSWPDAARVHEVLIEP